MGNGFTRGWLNKHRVLRKLMVMYVTIPCPDRGYCHSIGFTVMFTHTFSLCLCHLFSSKVNYESEMVRSVIQERKMSNYFKNLPHPVSSHCPSFYPFVSIGQIARILGLVFSYREFWEFGFRQRSFVAQERDETEEISTCLEAFPKRQIPE